MKKILLIICLCVLFGGCASGGSIVKPGVNFNDYKRVAILPFEYNRELDVKVEDLFEQELMLKGYELVERSKVDAVLKEQQFQQSSLVNQEKVVEVGKILNVNAVVIGKTSELRSQEKSEISITAKLVSVKDSSILWSGSGESGSGGGILDFRGLAGQDSISSKIKAVVKRIIEGLPSVQ
jgi:PBP1b-binding outer membrane lipoprotein LpoB